MTATIFPGHYDPATQTWRSGEPEISYSEERLRIHETQGLLTMDGAVMDGYTSLVSITPSGEQKRVEDDVYTFTGTFWDIFRDVFNIACQRVHINNRKKGFWPDNTDVKGSMRLALYPETHGRNAGEMLALMTSEESEALDAVRSGGLEHKDDKLPHRSGFFTEICDSVIRAMDGLGGTMAEAGTIIVEKLTYNKDQRGHMHGRKF
jgi:hypothetical protein